MEHDQMPREMPDDLAALWLLIRRAAGAMDRQGEALFRRELGISLARFLVLSVVDAYPGPLSQQAVAGRLGLTKGTVSRQIEAAAAAGQIVVTPSPHSRRENAVALTDAGTALVRRGDALTQHAQIALREAIDPTQFPIIRTALQQLVDALDT